VGVTKQKPKKSRENGSHSVHVYEDGTVTVGKKGKGKGGHYGGKVK